MFLNVATGAIFLSHGGRQIFHVIIGSGLENWQEVHLNDNNQVPKHEHAFITHSLKSTTVTKFYTSSDTRQLNTVSF